MMHIYALYMPNNAGYVQIGSVPNRAKVSVPKPKPVTIPSLKSETGGNDPSINLVAKGWGDNESSAQDDDVFDARSASARPASGRDEWGGPVRAQGPASAPAPATAQTKTWNLTGTTVPTLIPDSRKPAPAHTIPTHTPSTSASASAASPSAHPSAPTAGAGMGMGSGVSAQASKTSPAFPSLAESQASAPKKSMRVGVLLEMGGGVEVLYAWVWLAMGIVIFDFTIIYLFSGQFNHAQAVRHGRILRMRMVMTMMLLVRTSACACVSVRLDRWAVM